jgi:hypothetical protein
MLGAASLGVGLVVACSSAEPAPHDSPTAGHGGSQAGPTAGSSSDSAGHAPQGGSASAAGAPAMGGDAAEAGAGGDGPSDAPRPRGACAVSTRLGRFSVERQKDFGVVQGTILDGIVPTSIPEVVTEQEGCKLLRRRNLGCSPACSSSETCGEDGKCIPYPRQISVGDVTIAGLTKPVSMTPQQPGALYFAPGQDNPPFSPTARVELDAAGSDEVKAFQLLARGSEPLLEAPSWVLQEGKALELSWPAGSEVTSVGIELTIDQHGSSPLSLTCELADTGRGTVPGELIDRLITSGVSGFPNGRIQRRSVDHVDSKLGCIELSVGSTLAARVRVAGFTPCQSDADCPSGTTCDLAQERCF